jgi:hypothetical protein
MSAFVIIGAISMITGVLFIFMPETMKRLSEASIRLVTNFDVTALSYRTGLGIFLIIASLLFFFVAYYIRIKS